MSASATQRPYLKAEQVSVLRELTKEFGIDPDDITFLDNGEPWLSSRVRLEIARKSEQFEAISEGFDQFIPALAQVVHTAEVTTRAGRSFRRSGVAEIGETLPNGEVSDPHELAASRALGAALGAAGFDPLRKARGQKAEVRGHRPIEMVDDDAAAARLTHLGQIHMLAEQAGLIERTQDGTDLTKYRDFLAEHYGVISCAGMNEVERASVIAALRVRVRQS